MYDRHPWIEKIEYTMNDFAGILALYGAVIFGVLYYWDRNKYERYVNENKFN